MKLNILTFKLINISIPRVWLYKHVLKVVDSRKNEKTQRKDYMQLLLDSEIVSNENKFLDSNDLNKTYLDKKMNKNVGFKNIVFMYNLLKIILNFKQIRK
jgi:hypothetical protein